MQSTRIRASAAQAPDPSGDYVLYWMTAARRSRSNFALDRAIHWARELGRPLLVVELMQGDHEYASPRFEAFVRAGMRDNAAAFEKAGVSYVAHPGVDRSRAGELWRSAIAKACLVVSDDWPCFFLRDVHASLLANGQVYVEAVDSCGLVPLRATPKAFSRAHDFRRWWQREFLSWWSEHPRAEPLKRLKVPALKSIPKALRSSKLDLPDDDWQGGPVAALRRLSDFVSDGLPRYLERNHPDRPAQSRLSGYLHWGHLGAHEIANAVLRDADWDPGRLGDVHRGQREGWWGLPAAHEAFMDQILTWRELGFNQCWHREDYKRYEALPAWAQRTLHDHREDERPYLYSLDDFEGAHTHDPIWNAAQRELVATGYMHNYLRMLWGKKILHWSASPEEAMHIMLTLNDRYAIDGRDPNSYTGIRWVLGAHDRAWGPERPVFGKVRYMTSDSTKRKLKMSAYLERWGGQTSLLAANGE